MKKVLIFILGFIIGLVGFLILDNMQENTNIDENPSASVSDKIDNEENPGIQIIEGELTGFADSFTVEIVTVDGPISCHVYDENLARQLEGLIENKIKVEIEYNKDTQIRIIKNIL